MIKCGEDRVDEMSVMFPTTKHLKLKNQSPNDQVLKMVQDLPRTEDWKLTVSRKCFDEAVREFAKAENELVAKLNAETQKRLNALKCQMDEDHACVYKSCLETSVKDMDGMTDEYNKLRSFVLQSDASLDELKKERDRLQLQVKELTDKIHGMAEQDEAIMAAVDAKVEEWKQVFSKKEEESLRSQEDVQERDIQIKMLKKDKELLLATRQRKMEELKSKLDAAESRAADAEQVLNVTKDHVEEKEKALDEALVRLRQFESGSLSLDAALAEIKQCSNQIKDMTEEKRSSVVLEKELRLLDAKFKAKVGELSKVKQDQEALLRDFLQTIGTKQQASSCDGDITVGGMGDWTSNPAQQVKSQILQLVERNQDLNQKLKQAHEETTRSFSQLSDAKEKLHSTCRSFFKKLEEKEAALSEAEDNVKSMDRVINELRGQLSTPSTRDSLRHEVCQSESHRTLKLAQQTIKDLHGQLDKKENVIKKLHKQAEQNQKDMREKYREELGRLEQKLTSHMDSSLGCFKQQAQELMDMSTFEVPNAKQLELLKEIVDEQECSLISLTEELRLTSGELEQRRMTLETQAKKHADEVSITEAGHASQVRALTDEAEDLRRQVDQMEKEMNDLRAEVEAQNEANACAASNLEIGKLKAQVVHKDKQIKRLSKVLLDMRAEMTSAAEQRVRAEAAKQQDTLNVQQLIDKHTKDLEVQAQELRKELQAVQKSERTAKGQASTLKQE
ncbi:centrosomal of 290 kDa isoform X1, partial [Solea senegalensis]